MPESRMTPLASGLYIAAMRAGGRPARFPMPSYACSDQGPAWADTEFEHGSLPCQRR
jgi:hypothetical protein